jgi:hypothetical protein
MEKPSTGLFTGRLTRWFGKNYVKPMEEEAHVVSMSI